MKFKLGLYNRMVGFKASAEENIVTEKKKMFYFTTKARISHWLYDI